MSEFITSFTKAIGKLYKMQVEAPPALILEGIAKVLRFGLLAICIVTGILLVQFVLALCSKKLRKTAIPIGVTCLLLAGVITGAFLPFTAAPKAGVESAALQGVTYVEASVLAAEEAAAEQAASSGADAAAQEDADVAEEVTQEEEEETVVDNSLKRTIASSQELTQVQIDAVTQLLNHTKCMRTLRQTLPEQSATNVLLRLSDDTKWQVLILQDRGYIYATEGTGFLCRIQDYNVFYKELQSILKAG